MMRAELEIWIRDLVLAIENGTVPEDSRVELKRDLPPPNQKTARRIAGHANATTGDSFLWVCGIDERGTYGELDTMDLAQWIEEITSHFDDEFPLLQDDMVVTTDNGRVRGLLFESSRRPYVVKADCQGVITLEVPWRRGTRIGSARRSDLVRMLMDDMGEVNLEYLDGVATHLKFQGRQEGRIDLYVYASLRRHEIITLPFHKARVRLRSTNTGSWVTANRVLVSNDALINGKKINNGRSNIQVLQTELEVNGAGQIHIQAIFDYNSFDGSAASYLCNIELCDPFGQVRAFLDQTLPYVPPTDHGVPATIGSAS